MWMLQQMVNFPSIDPVNFLQNDVSTNMTVRTDRVSKPTTSLKIQPLAAPRKIFELYSNI